MKRQISKAKSLFLFGRKTMKVNIAICIICSSATCLFFLLVFSNSSYANEGMTRSTPVSKNESKAKVSGKHKHDGFFLGLDLHVGYGMFYRRPPNPHTGSEGVDWNAKAWHQIDFGASLYIGGSIHEYIVLFHEVSCGYNEYIHGGVGIRAFLPYNMFLQFSATVGLPYLVNGKLAVGKEWWISDDWAFGFIVHGTISGYGLSGNTLGGAGTAGLSWTYH